MQWILKLIIFVGLLTLAGLASFDIKGCHDVQRAQADFFYRTRDQVIIGKTIPQTINTFGQPAWRKDDENGDVEMRYNGPCKSYCDIVFVNGVALFTKQWSR